MPPVTVMRHTAPTCDSFPVVITATTGTAATFMTFVTIGTIGTTESIGTIYQMNGTGPHEGTLPSMYGFANANGVRRLVSGTDGEGAVSMRLIPGGKCGGSTGATRHLWA